MKMEIAGAISYRRDVIRCEEAQDKVELGVTKQGRIWLSGRESFKSLDRLENPPTRRTHPTLNQGLFMMPAPVPTKYR